MEQCAFCQIVAGDSDAHFLYENDLTVAFLDENPASHGHTLVVPKAHREYLFTADESLPVAVVRALHRLANAIDHTLDPDGVSLFYTSSTLVGRVSHAHVHLVPRYADDDIHVALDRRSLDERDATRLAAQIRASL